MATPYAATPVAIAEEDQLRAQLYGCLARLLAAPPDAQLLKTAASLRGDETPMGRALDALARAAAAASPEAAEREYNDLFIGIGRGELVPYASYYLTGFLNEKPLAKLRQDMARLGIVRASGVKEPEDHIGTLCEIMEGLIIDGFGGAPDLAEQERFFDVHLAPWAGRFFADLEAAEHAALYAPVGTIGRLFMEIEADAFEMEP